MFLLSPVMHLPCTAVKNVYVPLKKEEIKFTQVGVIFLFFGKATQFLQAFGLNKISHLQQNL